jgi:hypothetical protein
LFDAYGTLLDRHAAMVEHAAAKLAMTRHAATRRAMTRRAGRVDFCVLPYASQ